DEYGQMFEYHQLRLDDLFKNFLNYLETCPALRRRVGQLPQAVMRKRGSARSSTTQVSRPVANAPVSMLIRFGSTSGRSLGVCPSTTILPKSTVLLRNSSRIHSKSSTLWRSSGMPGRTPAWQRKCFRVMIDVFSDAKNLKCSSGTAASSARATCSYFAPIIRLPPGTP